MLRKLQQPPIKELCWDAEFAHTLDELSSKSFEQHFDLLLLDEHFPGTDTTGSEYIATLRQQGIHTPVLIAPANCSDIDLALYLSRYDEAYRILDLSRLYATLCQLHSLTMVELRVA
jgi:CheY-like chemotaxis protein